MQLLINNYSCENNDELNTCMQNGLDRMVHWADNNHLKVNVEKLYFTIFKRQNDDHDVTLNIGNTELHHLN